jgi:hypothetical protein
VDNKEKINLILYDFSNAFGSLLPDLLIKKLEMYGIHGAAQSWLKSFLIDRKQIVKMQAADKDGLVSTINSNIMESSMGVPQGTVLGPITYLAYANDMPLWLIACTLILFADDSSFLIKGKNYTETNTKSSTVNDSVIKFANDNFLQLNADKTVVMQIRSSNSQIVIDPKLVINGKEISVTSQSKILGVILSDNMKWKNQCNTIVNKLRSITFLFTALRFKVSETALRQVYFAYVQSQILYSIVIWGGSSHMQDVFIAQKRVVRTMAGAQRYWNGVTTAAPCRPLFLKFNILPVYCLYILECAKFVRRHPEKFIKNIDCSESNKCDTRNTKINPENLSVKLNRIKLTDQNPEIMIPRVWNHLPLILRNIEDDRLFVKLLKTVLFKYMFYDMMEYFSCTFEDAL